MPVISLLPPESGPRQVASGHVQPPTSLAFLHMQQLQQLQHQMQPLSGHFPRLSPLYCRPESSADNSLLSLLTAWKLGLC